MQSNEIRSRFLRFFESRGHKIIPSSSLIPENDPSVLFTTAGMQPLVPYLLGQAHPMGKRIVNVQKCVRTQDIDEVGDKTHDTFFEMMGNWSLGDYFKEDAIKWSYQFLTSKEKGLGLDSKRLYVTIFEGDENAPMDEEAKQIWKKYVPENRIYFMSAESNWWSVGNNGPCGPDTEMFYDITEEGLGDLTKEEYIKADKGQKVIEIWNDVFMEYEKKDGKVIGKLKQKNVDTGAGVERVAMAVQGKDNIFETDIFTDVIKILKNKSQDYNEKSARIVADHFRTVLFMCGDGITPSNKGAGYIMRRLIRRAWTHIKIKLGAILVIEDFVDVLDNYVLIYKDTYPELSLVKENNYEVIRNELNKFDKTLTQGLKEFEKGENPFTLFTTYGFPIELTIELAKEKGRTVDLEDFTEKMTEHQKLSHTASASMFKSGLAS